MTCVLASRSVGYGLKTGPVRRRLALPAYIPATRRTHQDSGAATLARWTFAYDAVGNRSTIIDSNGATTTYVYDSKNRLTDVVHLNQFNEKMLPDYIFEYNSTGLVTQMTTTEEGGSYYYIWKYTYDNGLRTSEKCFSKERRLMGTIQYEYK